MPDDFRALDAYWRAANYLSVGQIYLLANPLLRVGKAPSVEGSPRRPLTDLLTDDSLPAATAVLAGVAG